ncbi:hypothetical protein HF086_018204 [Spodoptera exigua]|uniref:Uncharacterized protein n=1 Tax=Spodoptera exigua TaxID=7107 RepID=A0A922SIN4_SPOEX|nr:hypothetical protein HF086_018204 [Spodoptera exigua]
MMDPNTNNDSGYAPSNIDAEKEHTPPASPTNKDDKKTEDNAELPKKPELNQHTVEAQLAPWISPLIASVHQLAP